MTMLPRTPPTADGLGLTIITFVWTFNRSSSFILGTRALRSAIHVGSPILCTFPTHKLLSIPGQPQGDVPVITPLKAVMIGYHHGRLGLYTVEVRGQPLKDDSWTLLGWAQLPVLALHSRGVKHIYQVILVKGAGGCLEVKVSFHPLF